MRDRQHFCANCRKVYFDVWIKVGKTKVNAKSIMGLISLAVAQGTEVVIGAEEKMKKGCGRAY